ncbi:hypothetical protein PUN28_019686 [Cardiocondyla obscurior]|uniref:Uncharacterized protein n=1 Tax=Cardiocondyla obscurior TaxID=286306 RepID=A0AAW2EA22_9HYME
MAKIVPLEHGTPVDSDVKPGTRHAGRIQRVAENTARRSNPTRGQERGTPAVSWCESREHDTLQNSGPVPELPNKLLLTWGLNCTRTQEFSPTYRYITIRRSS